jgi:hypothetical protein
VPAIRRVDEWKLCDLARFECGHLQDDRGQLVRRISGSVKAGRSAYPPPRTAGCRSRPRPGRSAARWLADACEIARSATAGPSRLLWEIRAVPDRPRTGSRAR